MGKVMKVITVLEGDVNYDIPEAAEHFIDYFQSKINRIPEEFRKTTRIEIEATPSYEGCANLDLKISYSREETDEEFEYRAARESSEQARLRERKLLQLASLKRELGVE